MFSFHFVVCCQKLTLILRLSQKITYDVPVQVSPFEVEEALITHAWVELAICFAVSSKLYGEEVGCALVLCSSAPTDTTTQDVLIKMRE